MRTETVTLTGFLLARIAEDKAAAKAVSDRNGPQWATRDLLCGLGITGSVGPGNPRAYASDEVEIWDDESALGMFPETAKHVCRHDPARVLAEYEAKRHIVELHPLTADVVPVHSGPSPGCGCETCHTVTASSINDIDYIEALGPCDTLRALALVYADHPDYREEWRP